MLALRAFPSALTRNGLSKISRKINRPFLEQPTPASPLFFGFRSFQLNVSGCTRGSAPRTRSSVSGSDNFGPFLLSHSKESLKNLTIVRALVVDDRGNTSIRDVEKQHLACELDLPVRDLRTVDVSFKSQIPAILARSKAIVVNLGPLKAVITASSTSIFSFEEPDLNEFLAHLRDHILLPTGQRGEGVLPYEIRVLEAMLSFTCVKLDDRRKALDPRVTQVLFELQHHQDDALPTLFDIRQRVTEFEHETDEVRKAIEETLSNDEDMANMYLTERLRGSSRPAQQHQELEIMMEAYYKQVQEIFNDIESWKTNMDNAEEIAKIQLNSIRNKIMRLELVFSMAATTLAGGGVVASVFGMNLPSHLENSHQAFVGITSGVIFGCVTAFSLLYRRYRRLGLLDPSLFKSFPRKHHNQDGAVIGDTSPLRRDAEAASPVPTAPGFARDLASAPVFSGTR